MHAPENKILSLLVLHVHRDTMAGSQPQKRELCKIWDKSVFYFSLHIYPSMQPEMGGVISGWSWIPCPSSRLTFVLSFFAQNNFFFLSFWRDKTWYWIFWPYSMVSSSVVKIAITNYKFQKKVLTAPLLLTHGM